MKNFLLALCAVIACISCSKDEAVAPSLHFNSAGLSEILVTAAVTTWVESQCETGSTSCTGEMITYIEGAHIEVLDASVSSGNDFYNVVAVGNTNKQGEMIFRNLNPGMYSVRIHSSLGEQWVLTTTEINKRAHLHFSF